MKDCLHTYILTLMLCATALIGENPAATTNTVNLAASLVDGTRLVCRPTLEKIAFKTSFSEMNIPMSMLKKVTFDHKKGDVNITLTNGDSLHGEWMLKEFSATSLLGTHSIPITNITELVNNATPVVTFKDSPSIRNACINMLRQMESGKEQWALEQGKATGNIAITKEVGAYIKGGWRSTCSAGGTYSINRIGRNATCSVPGHQLPH